MITGGIDGMMIPNPRLSMNTDSRTKVRAAREDVKMRVRESRRGAHCPAYVACRASLRRVASGRACRHVALTMDRTDPLPPEIELAQLLQRCAAHDSAAFRTLYDKTSPILFARLLRMLRRRSVAEEALQDVYVRIWERAAQYQAHRGRALAWMVTIARYCAIDLMRRERMTLVGDDALAQVADEAHGRARRVRQA